MKRIVTCMLSICLMICCLCVIPKKVVRAENVQRKEQQKISKCHENAVHHPAFVGDFCDDAKEVYLNIYKSGKKYYALYRQFRLAQIDGLEGTVKNGVLTLKGQDPSDKPMTITVSREGNKRILTFKRTSWMYFKQGSSITLKRCSANKG